MEDGVTLDIVEARICLERLSLLRLLHGDIRTDSSLPKLLREKAS